MSDGLFSQGFPQKLNPIPTDPTPAANSDYVLLAPLLGGGPPPSGS